MDLKKYIYFNFSDNQSRFAEHAGVDRQTVRKWIKAGWIVVDGNLYSPRRDVNPPPHS